MTDAEKREKVIRGLELCAYDPDPGQELKEVRSCPECPYYRAGCSPQLIRDALALLREQEPRVMTQEEVLATQEGVVVWMEENSESGNYIQPIVSTGNGCLGNFYIGVGAYGVEMRERRFWSSRPSEQQMRDTKWEVTDNG